MLLNVNSKDLDVKRLFISHDFELKKHIQKLYVHQYFIILMSGKLGSNPAVANGTHWILKQKSYIRIMNYLFFKISRNF